jgi:hypothetical protein
VSGLLADRVVRRSVLLLGCLALLSGLGTLVMGLAEGQEFLATRGVRLGTLMHLNPLGSLATIALAGMTIGAALGRSRVLLLGASAGWLLAVVQCIVQSGRDPNVLGGTASTLAFFLAMTASLAVIGLTPVGGASAGREREP